MLEQKLEDDIKAALLSGEKEKAMRLRTLKAALLSYKVAEGKRDSGISDDEIIAILSKEAKKRQESADLYKQGGRTESAEAELAEKALIEAYLPAQLSEDEIKALIDEAITTTGASTMQDMGKVIGAVKAKAGAAADGGLIAGLVKERLS
jgi:uncharacterized protein YqeY